MNSLIKNFQFSRKWALKAIYSLLDQGIFSTSNFFLTFYLGRQLSESEYGAFGIVFVIFLFLSGFYSSLIFEPMMVFGSGYLDNDYKEYLIQLIGMVIKVSILVIFFGLLTTFAIWLITRDKLMVGTLLGMLLSLPMIMSYWWARQACYIQSKPNLAIFGDIVYSIALISSLLGVVSLGLINSSVSFIIMGFSGCLGLPFILWKLGIDIKKAIIRISFFSIGKDYLQHWQFGKWALASSFAYGASTLAFPPIIGIILGFEQVGLYKALQNLVSPLQQINTAFMILLIPWATQQRLKFGKQIFRHRINEFIISLLFISALYLLPINIFAKEIIGFYQKDYYLGFLWAIPIFSLMMLLTAIINSFGIALRALELPKIILQSKLVSVIFIFTFCVLITLKFGFFGLMIGIILSLLIEIFVLVMKWKRVLIEKK